MSYFKVGIKSRTESEVTTLFYKMTKNKELSIRNNPDEKDESMAQSNNQASIYLHPKKQNESSAVPKGLNIQSLSNNMTVKENNHCATAEVYQDQ